MVTGQVCCSPRACRSISNSGGCLWKSFLCGRPVVELTGLTFDGGFIEKKIQLARGRIALQLLLPKIVVAFADPRGQPVKVRRSKLRCCQFDFFHRSHGHKLVEMPKFSRLLNFLPQLCAPASRIRLRRFPWPSGGRRIPVCRDRRQAMRSQTVFKSCGAAGFIRWRCVGLSR